MRRTKEVRPWVDKLIDNSLGRAGLPGDNKLLLMASAACRPQPENKLSGSPREATNSKQRSPLPAPCWSPGPAVVWPSRDPALGKSSQF